MGTPRSSELTEAISALIVQQPFFASLLFDMLTITETDALPTAATDGQRIMVNPKFFKKLDVKERIFVLAHEITHVILQHPARMKAYMDLGYGPDLKKWSNSRYNKAADYVINAYLTELQVGKQPLNSLSNPHITSKDLVDEVYLKIPEDEDDDKGWDTHLPQSGDPLDKATIQRSVAQAATAQKMMGKLPGSLQRLIDEICEPQVTWQDYLRRVIVSNQGSDQATWNKPNRRRLAVPPHVYWPGRCGTRSGAVAVEIDTSGSVSEAELKTFLSELSGILSDVQPECVYLMYVDAQLQGDVIEIHDVSELLDCGSKAAGGGGTDMTVVFREIEEKQLPVEHVVVLTDGGTPFGEDCGIPTVWCITSDAKAPWGITVNVKIAH